MGLGRTEADLPYLCYGTWQDWSRLAIPLLWDLAGLKQTCHTSAMGLGRSVADLPYLCYGTLITGSSRWTVNRTAHCERRKPCLKLDRVGRKYEWCNNNNVPLRTSARARTHTHTHTEHIIATGMRLTEQTCVISFVCRLEVTQQVNAFYHDCPCPAPAHWVTRSTSSDGNVENVH